jgi:hypothetical protein
MASVGLGSFPQDVAVPFPFDRTIATPTLLCYIVNDSPTLADTWKTERVLALSRRVTQIILAHDVVAFEHVARLVSKAFQLRFESSLPALPV